MKKTFAEYGSARVIEPKKGVCGIYGAKKRLFQEIRTTNANKTEDKK